MNCIEDRLVQHGRAGNDFGIHNVSVLSNLNCHNDCTRDPSRHCDTGTDQVSFVEKQLLGDLRRNPNLVRLLSAWIRFGLPDKTGIKNR